MSLTIGSLFSGIGGLDLGVERAGGIVRWQSEIDPYCCRVLAKHWPDVPNLGDVRLIDWSTVERVDLLCGGYPCQPFSLAGSRGGETDARHLWPHMRDAVRHLRPRLVLLENVPGHLSLGFGRVLGDLAELGYDCEWDCIPAAAVGAPHLRYRVFVVAYADDGGRVGRAGQLWQGGRSESSHRSGMGDADGAPSDTHATTSGSQSPTSQPGWWAVEPDVGRVAHGVPHRVDRLRALGNAVVPQVAEWIGRRIMEAAA